MFSERLCEEAQKTGYTPREKIFVNHITNNGQIHRIHKEPLKLNSKKKAIKPANGQNTCMYLALINNMDRKSSVKGMFNNISHQENAN